MLKPLQAPSDCICLFNPFKMFVIPLFFFIILPLMVMAKRCLILLLLKVTNMAS